MDKLAHMANWPLHMSVVYLISGMDHVCAEITPLCVKQSTVKVLERSFVGAHEKSRMLQLTTVTYCVGLSLFPPPSGNILWHGLSFDKASKKLLQEPNFFCTISLLFHFIISLCIAVTSTFVSSFFEKPLCFSLLLSSAPHFSVRLSTTQGCFMQSVCSAGPSVSSIPALLVSEVWWEMLLLREIDSY